MKRGLNKKNFLCENSLGFPSSKKSSLGNKRGSHVGVVLSFLIFVTFLAFMYATLAPAIKLQEDKKAILDYLEIALENNLSDNLISVSVVNNTPIPEDEKCIEFKDFNETYIDQKTNKSFISSRLLVKDEGNELFPSSITNDWNLFVNRSDNPNAHFFRVKISDKFDAVGNSGMSGCIPLAKGIGYRVGGINNNRYFFETKINEMRDAYDSYYNSLKEEFGVSAGNEFGFDFEFASGTSIIRGGEETKASIYIEEIPVQYVDTSGEVNLGLFRIKVW